MRSLSGRMQGGGILEYAAEECVFEMFWNLACSGSQNKEIGMQIWCTRQKIWMEQPEATETDAESIESRHQLLFASSEGRK